MERLIAYPWRSLRAPVSRVSGRQLADKSRKEVSSRHSIPYYRGRPESINKVIRQASQFIKEGMEWVVDIDLANFFDRINHDWLMQRHSKGVGDKKAPATDTGLSGYRNYGRRPESKE